MKIILYVLAMVNAALYLSYGDWYYAVTGGSCIAWLLYLYKPINRAA